MKIDGPFYAQLSGAAAEASRLAAMGYDGVYTLEGSWDPFLPLVMASEHAPELDIATAIAVAFPRNPMHLAYQAWDLQRFSSGKFMLGIGSQVKAHIENRFGTDFSPPATRMREYILALKAIFDCWQNGTKMNFKGDYYRHTLMTPMFNPGALDCGPPPILLGALGPRMTEVAGRSRHRASRACPASATSAVGMTWGAPASFQREAICAFIDQPPWTPLNDRLV